MTASLTSTPALVAAFLARTLPKPAWTHVAHLRVGLWPVRTLGESGALAALRERIRAYNESVGTANRWSITRAIGSSLSRPVENGSQPI